jgi:predicted TIM-barrel fold metal-dependent hydrolase
MNPPSPPSGAAPRRSGRWLAARLFAPVAALSIVSSPLACLAQAAPGAPAASYTMADFARVAKIDAHVHLHGAADRFMAQATQDGFRVVTINVDYPDFPPIADQQRDAISLRQRYPGRVAFAATFSAADFSSPGWSDAAVRGIAAAVAQGAIGVKVWKNIGMDLRDADGHFVMLDDLRLKPIFDYLESKDIVLLGHQAEPLNCWLPFEQMTVLSDRTYFQEHPQYYMVRHPEVPSHEAQLGARDHVLEQHPALRFDSVHLASLEWDVDEVARFLDRFPGANVDLAARMVHLQHQAVNGREKVRRFLIRYQDRILYGTDIAHARGEADAAVATEAHDAWRDDWRFLNTADPLHSPDFPEVFTGLALPATVIDKIYRTNAQNLFPGAWDAAAGGAPPAALAPSAAQIAMMRIQARPNH